jgi:hypothetical protein
MRSKSPLPSLYTPLSSSAMTHCSYVFLKINLLKGMQAWTALHPCHSSQSGLILTLFRTKISSSRSVCYISLRNAPSTQFKEWKRQTSTWSFLDNTVFYKKWLISLIFFSKRYIFPSTAVYSFNDRTKNSLQLSTNSSRSDFQQKYSF